MRSICQHVLSALVIKWFIFIAKCSWSEIEGKMEYSKLSLLLRFWQIAEKKTLVFVEMWFGVFGGRNRLENAVVASVSWNASFVSLFEGVYFITVANLNFWIIFFIDLLVSVKK